MFTFGYAREYFSTKFQSLMKQATFSIAIVARTTRKNPTIANLFARITFNSKRTEFSINRSVVISQWDKRSSKIKGTSINARKLNNHIIDVKGKILIAYEELKYNRNIISPLTIKARYLNQDTSELTLLTAFEYHNLEVSSTLAPGTARHYKTCLAHLKRFLKKIIKADDVYLSKLTFSFITRFELFLRKYKPTDHQKPPGNNTIMKHIQRVRKVVSLAVKMEWLEKDPFAKYKCNFIPSTRKYLSSEELESLEALSHLNNRLEYIRDLFIFSCYTGLVYIDTMELTPKHIVQGIDGNKWIHTERRKTLKAVRIPLLPKAEIIIAKYKNDPRSVYAGTVFPKISNQRLNAYLKELASLANIKSILTFHVARHTFATTIALMNGLPIETLSKILGHSKITTTQMYAKVLNQKVSLDMGNLKEVILKKEDNKRNQISTDHIFINAKTS